MKVIYLNDIDLRPYVVEKEEGQSTLALLQELVEGLVESVSVEKGIDLWVNEEGLFRQDFLPNYFAMEITTGLHLVGPAVLSGVNKRGDTTSITDYYTEVVWATYGKSVYNSSEVVAIRAKQLEEIREKGVSV
jgi:hypothetical protein